MSIINEVLKAAHSEQIYNKTGWINKLSREQKRSSCNVSYLFVYYGGRVVKRFNEQCYARMRTDTRTEAELKKPYGGYFMVNDGFINGDSGDPFFNKKEKLEYIAALMSKQSLFYDSIVKHNPPIKVNGPNGITVTVNTPAFIRDHGFVLYNTDKTKVPALMVFLGYLRYLSEKPECVKNYFLFKERGCNIRAALLLCNIPHDLKTSTSLTINYFPAAHPALFLGPEHYPYLMKNGINAVDNYPYMSMLAGYGHSWSRSIQRGDEDIDIFKHTMNSKDPKEMVKYGRYLLKNEDICVPTQFYLFSNKYFNNQNTGATLERVRKNRDMFRFLFNDVTSFITDVMDERFSNVKKIQRDIAV